MHGFITLTEKEFFLMVELSCFTFKLKLQLDCLVSLFAVSHVLMNHEDSSTLMSNANVYIVHIILIIKNDQLLVKIVANIYLRLFCEIIAKLQI